MNDQWSYHKSATFFASVPVRGLFPIDSLVHLTYDQFTPRVLTVEGHSSPLLRALTWFSWLRCPTKAQPPPPLALVRKMALPSTATARASMPSSADDIARDLEQLRDRFRKTTNALASAAHDLKTPLAILNGYIELLQSQKLGPLNERQREIMGDMFLSGQRLQHFIQDFLTFSRARNRRTAHAVRGRRHERLPLRSLPALVGAGFRSAVWHCIFWPMTN